MKWDSIVNVEWYYLTCDKEDLEKGRVVDYQENHKKRRDMRNSFGKEMYSRQK